MKVYIASKTCHWPHWQALRAAGVHVISSWIDQPFNHDDSDPDPDTWSEHWAKCVQEASDADVVLLYASNGEKHHGSLIEMGAGLAMGKRIFLVGGESWSIRHHPRVRVFSTLADAVTAILAAQAGEKLRVA
jgi:hypothetical protein